MKRLVLIAWLALATGCAAQAGGDPGSGGGDAVEFCSAQVDGPTMCSALTTYLERYGCQITGCDTSCPAGTGICTNAIDDCERAAQSLAGTPPEALAAACDDVVAYCNSVIDCTEPPTPYAETP